MKENEAIIADATNVDIGGIAKIQGMVDMMYGLVMLRLTNQIKLSEYANLAPKKTKSSDKCYHVYPEKDQSTILKKSDVKIMKACLDYKNKAYSKEDQSLYLCLNGANQCHECPNRVLYCKFDKKDAVAGIIIPQHERIEEKYIDLFAHKQWIDFTKKKTTLKEMSVLFRKYLAK